MPSVARGEPLGPFFRAAELRLQGGDAILNAVIVDARDRRGVFDLRVANVDATVHAMLRTGPHHERTRRPSPPR
jgi:hypothetical protein